MKKTVLVILSVVMSIVMCKVNVQASTIFTSFGYTEIDGYYYTLWKDMGDTTMAIHDRRY